MLLDADTQDWLDTLAAKGPAQPPVTLGEAWRASWAESGLHTIGGLRAPQAQALDELRAAYRTAAGEDVRDAARRQGVPLEAAKPDQEAGYIESLTRGLPDEAQKRIAPLLDINARASSIAAKTERDAGDVASRAFGVSAHATMFLAGLARNMVDPETIAVSAAVAAATPAGVGLPAFLAREAAVNAGATALLHPAVSAGRETLGLEPTSFVGDVVESAVGGAALGGVFRAGGAVARRLYGSREVGSRQSGEFPAAESRLPTADLPTAVGDAVGGLEPEDFDLAARHVENRAIEDAGALRGDALGVAEHARAIDDAVAALDRGEGATLAAPAFDAGAEARAAAIDARAAELSPRLFAQAAELDASLQTARAEIQTILARPEPTSVLEGRIAALENDLAQTGGKRRASPRAKEMRAELDDVRAERAALIEQQRALNEEQLSVLRASIVDLQSARGALGPRVRAVRAHAAQMLGGDNAQALAFAGARDARREAAGEPASFRLTEGGKNAGAPVEPARPLSDYPLRELAPEPAKEGATAKQQATPRAPADQAAQKPSLGATPELAALRADAERAIAETGDFDFHITDDDGTARVVKASELLREADDDAVAARELEQCMTGVEQEKANES